MLVNEITQITAHDWNVVHGYKRSVAAKPYTALVHCLDQSVICCHDNSLRPQL